MQVVVGPSLRMPFRQSAIGFYDHQILVSTSGPPSDDQIIGHHGVAVQCENPGGAAKLGLGLMQT